ncbi:uncharacterized protein LOC144927272 [Branchiostoma floridae x Branchiostoma belcheri]
MDEDIRNNDYDREGVSQSQKEILKLPRQQNDGVSKRKKGRDPVLVQFYEERGMAVAKKDCPLIEAAAKESGKTVQQVRNFIANYRRSQAFSKRSLPTDDMAAGNSGFTGSHNSGMSEESDELEETMEEVLSEQEESRTETLSRTHEAVEQYSDRNNHTGGKRKSSNSGPLVKRPKQAVTQPGPITIAEVTDNSIRISWTEAAGSKDSYRISLSNTDGVTAPSASVNPGDPLEYNFTGLTAGAEYTISVVTVSGGECSVARIDTQRTTVAQPGAINIAEVTEKSIGITWTEAAGKKDSYIISICPDTGVTNSAESVNAGDPLEHTFTTLTAGTEYTISVVTVSGGECSFPTIKAQRTTVAQPGPITIAGATENSIRITWTEAAGAKDSYDISITPDTGVTKPTGSVNTGHPLEHTFTTLTAGTEYTISVVTVSDGENSVARTETRRTTVAQPGAINIAEVTENSIGITWTEAAGAKDSYDISISPDTGVTNPTGSVNPGGPLQHTFTTLTAGTEYTVSVVTVSDGENSVARIETQRTSKKKSGKRQSSLPSDSPALAKKARRDGVTVGRSNQVSVSLSFPQAAQSEQEVPSVLMVNDKYDEGGTSQVQQKEGTVITMTKASQIQHKKGGKRKAKTRHVGESSDSEPPVKRSKQESVLLVNDKYGTSHGGTSSTNRQVAQFLQRHGATVHATALQASEDDKRWAEEDGVILHLPVKKTRDKRTPSLEWLTHYHSFHYPSIPQDLKCIVGHAGVSSEAAKSIQEDRCQHAKLILFNHDMPEDTEYYKGTEKAMATGKKMEDILEDTKNADAVFSMGRRIYDYFETKYRSLGENKPREHLMFLPRPSPVFEAVSVQPGGGGEKVVLTVGRVTEVDKLKGHDLVARALGEVVEKITNVRLRVRGIDEDHYEASKRILEEYLNSGKIKPILLPCGTQEDIADDMKQAHLVLMPSRAEPFGLIGLEAIAAGIPVLISDKSGLADMIKDLIDEEKCPADMRYRIVHTSVNESDLEVAAKEWAKRIVDTLQHSKHEFDKAAEFKKKLLESKYWEESHQNLLRVCGLID